MVNTYFTLVESMTLIYWFLKSHQEKVRLPYRTSDNIKLLSGLAYYCGVTGTHVIATVEAIVGNVNHLSEFESLHYSCEVLI